MMKKRDQQSNSQKSLRTSQDQSNIITFHQPKQYSFNQLVDKNKFDSNPYQTTQVTKRETNTSEIGAFKSISTRIPSAIMISATYGNKLDSGNASALKEKLE